MKQWIINIFLIIFLEIITILCLVQVFRITKHLESYPDQALYITAGKYILIFLSIIFLIIDISIGIQELINQHKGQ